MGEIHECSQHEGASPAKKHRGESLKNTLLTISEKEYETAFSNRLRSFFLKSSVEFKSLPCFLDSVTEKIINRIELERKIHENLKINIVVECKFINILREQCDRAFKTQNTPIYRESDLSVNVEQLYKKIVIEMDESQMKKSG